MRPITNSPVSDGGAGQEDIDSANYPINVRDPHATTPAATTPPAEEDQGGGRKPRHLTIYGGLGYNADGTRRIGDPAAAAAGAGGGGGGSKSSSTTTSETAPGFGLDETILNGIKSLFANGSGYPIDLMKQQLLESTKGQGAANEDALRRDAIRRGIYRSGILSGNIAKNRASMTADYSRGVTNLLIEKAKADQEAKYKALDAAQKYVDSARDWLLRKESNSIQREVGMAQVRLGYARIDLEREQLAKQGHGGGGGGNGDADILNFLLQSGLLGNTAPPQAPF